MARSDIHLARENDEIELQFRLIMRRLAGGVSIITAGLGGDITGMTVTSVTSLSVDPPRLLVSINRQASSFALIERYGLFGVNILGADQLDRYSVNPWPPLNAMSRKLSNAIRTRSLSGACSTSICRRDRRVSYIGTVAT
jgi:hypothetical protein